MKGTGAGGYNSAMDYPRLKPASVFAVLFSMVLCLVLPCRGFASIGGLDTAALQRRAEKFSSAGQRIAFFAEQFLGTPYDTVPVGLYVARRAIVADSRVDCMYLVFRSVELALSSTPEGARKLALTMRFKTRGRLGPDGKVLNYGDRYQYGLDMILSGKWGRDITAALGKPEAVETSPRFQKMGVRKVLILPRDEIDGALSSFKSGDLVFFVKDPARRVAQEVIGHMGILAVSHGPRHTPMHTMVWLIHAHGYKVPSATAASPGKETGKVVKVLFSDYIRQMPFIGIMVTRFGRDPKGRL